MSRRAREAWAGRIEPGSTESVGNLFEIKNTRKAWQNGLFGGRKVQSMAKAEEGWGGARTFGAKEGRTPVEKARHKTLKGSYTEAKPQQARRTIERAKDGT